MDSSGSGWLAPEGAPYCARCRQPHLPVEAGGQFRCGNCDRLLVSRSPRPRSAPAAERGCRMRLLVLAAAGIALILWLAPPGRGAQPWSWWQGLWAPESGRGLGAWMRAHAPEESPEDLAREIAERRQDAPGMRDTFGWNLEMGDLALRYAQRLASTLEGAPPPPRDDASAPSYEDAWLVRIRHRLAMDRLAATHPETRPYLEEAASAYQQALSLAGTGEKRGLALRGLANVLCIQGRFAEGQRVAQRAGVLLGEQSTTTPIEVRCLAGMGRIGDAWEKHTDSMGLMGMPMGPMH